MIIKFKDGIERKCSDAKEVMLFKDGKPAGWLFFVKVNGIIEKAILKESLCDVEIIYDGTERKNINLTNYTEINSFTVDYDNYVTEIQLKRGMNDDNGI